MYLSLGDLQVIKQAVKVFTKTKNGAARDVMHRTVRMVMEKSCVNEISLPDCVIYRNGEKSISVYPREFTTGRECPNCGEDFMSYYVSIVSIWEGKHGKDFVSYGCHCGQVFGRVEANTDGARTMQGQIQAIL